MTKRGHLWRGDAVSMRGFYGSLVATHAKAIHQLKFYLAVVCSKGWVKWSVKFCKGSLIGARTALAETMAAFAGINFHRSDMAATSNWFLSLWLKMSAYVGYRYFKTLLEEDLRDQLARVALPTLICHGRHDQVAHPGWSEYMVLRLANCRLVWFEHSGHALMVEESSKLSQALATFVDS